MRFRVCEASRTVFYIADDWRVNDKLTLNIGLRWDYYSPYSDVANRIANFNPATATMQVAGQNGVSSTAGVQSDWKDFGPRFGFAYQAATHTVIRGGFGLFYNPNGNGGTYLRGERTLPFGPVYLQSPSDTFVTGPGAPTRFSQGFPAPPVINLAAAANPSGALLGTIDSFKAAYAEQMNFTIEQEIAPIQGMLRMGYVGNLGRRLDTTFNINQPVPGPSATDPRRPYYSVNPKITDVTFDVSDGNSSYHVFQVSFDKRLMHGLTALAGYTWAHSIDNVGTVFGGGTGSPQDPRCRSCDGGNSAFDIRHRFTASFTYQIPGFRNKGITGIMRGNWQTNGFVQVQTGLPFTPQLNSTTVNTGTASRPNCLAGPVPPFHQSLREWFNPAQFVTPPLYTYGNCGRDILYGPGRWNWDQSVFKNFPVTERVNLELRFEAFNVFKHPQFGQPNATIGSSQAGIINSIVGNPRDLQIAAHLTF